MGIVTDEDNQMAGTKHDNGKPRTDLMAPDALIGMARVLTLGSAKYHDRNWEKGLDYSRVYGAALRHLLAWWGSEDDDPETGENHIHHAACCLHFLQAYVERDMHQWDDRPGKRVTVLVHSVG